MSGNEDFSSRRKQSKFQKKINKIINDAKQFNEKIDFFIKKTDYQMALPRVKLNRGILRKMREQDEIEKKNRIRARNQTNYELAKRQYEEDLHNIMEKLISIKEK